MNSPIHAVSDHAISRRRLSYLFPKASHSCTNPFCPTQLYTRSLLLPTWWSDGKGRLSPRVSPNGSLRRGGAATNLHTINTRSSFVCRTHVARISSISLSHTFRTLRVSHIHSPKKPSSSSLSCRGRYGHLPATKRISKVHTNWRCRNLHRTLECRCARATVSPPSDDSRTMLGLLRSGNQ